MTVHGVTFTLKGIFFAAAAAQWLIVLLAAIFVPGRGGAWRKTETAILVSTLVFGATWYTILLRRPHNTAQQASVTGKARPGRTCEGIKAGANESQVKEKLGDPDHIRGEEETRGPAAEVWLYDDIRCAVHLYGDKVDSIE